MSSLPAGPDSQPEPQVTAAETHATTVSEDTWAILALPPAAQVRHYRLLEGLRTFAPDPLTGIRWVKQDRLAAAAGLGVDTVKRARRDLAEWGVIKYAPGVGRGRAGEYWIIPVPPGEIPAPPLKGRTNAAPFLTPGKGGWPTRKKGAAHPDKRGQPKSADQQKRKPQSKSSQSTYSQSKDKDQNQGPIVASSDRVRPAQPADLNARARGWGPPPLQLYRCGCGDSHPVGYRCPKDRSGAEESRTP